MSTKDLTSGFLTNEAEQQLGEVLQKALVSENQNPGRDGCPDPKTIRDIAFHKKIGDHLVFERVTLHMAECSACVRDALGYVAEYKESRKKHRRVQIALTAVAVVAIAIAIWAMVRTQPRFEMVVAPSSSQPVQIASDNSDRLRQPELGFEEAIIEIPSSWRGAATFEQQQIILKSGRLNLEIRLPIGSPDGKYKLRILDNAGKVRKSAEGMALTNQGITSFKIAIDTSDFPPGGYKLSLLEPGMDEWIEYPISVK
jgi:hypothetical protein